MKGLELSRDLYNNVGRTILEERVPHLMEKITIGLAGAGSECFGYDDEHSRDHDWGPGFCIWIPEEIYKTEGPYLQQIYDTELPDTYCGYSVRKGLISGEQRVGVIETERFYYQFIGHTGKPKELTGWLLAPESSYACVVNGETFWNPDSGFGQIRNILKEGYPEDIRCKKLAARVVTMAQAGQYNYPRCLKRGDKVAAVLSLAEFLKAAVSAMHLLEKRYTPFYKWMWKSACMLPKMGKQAVELKKLTDQPLVEKNTETIESVCVQIKERLIRQGLTDERCDFLEPHGRSIMDRICDKRIRSLPVLYG